MLALVDELGDDARRQYDRTVAQVLVRVRQRLVQQLEEAVAEDRWVRVSDAARIARRPEGTIRYWCRQGHVVARKIGARDWEIDRESLLRRAAA